MIRAIGACGVRQLLTRSLSILLLLVAPLVMTVAGCHSASMGERALHHLPMQETPAEERPNITAKLRHQTQVPMLSRHLPFWALGNSALPELSTRVQLPPPPRRPRAHRPQSSRAPPAALDPY